MSPEGRATLFLLPLLAILGGTAREARGQTEPEPLLDLAWSAPEECPSRDHLVARVGELVGAPPPGHHTLAARGRVTSLPAKEGASYRLELLVGGSQVPRTMNGSDCSRLADAAALILALDIDPEALAHGPRDAPSPEPPPPALSARPPPAARPKPVRPPPPHQEGIDGAVGARIVLDSGSLPRTTLGLGLLAEMARGPFALELQGTAYTSRFTVDGPRGGVGGAYVGLATFGALGCLQDHGPILAVRGCLGGELGRESTRGVSIAHPQAAASLWAALESTIAARMWPKAVASPTLGLALVLPLSAPRVEIQGVGTVFEPGVGAVRAFLGVSGNLF